MKSIKVMHLITSLNRGGTERMLQKTLPYLAKDINNYVCCLTVRGQIGEDLEKLGIEVTYLGYKNISDLPGVINNFRKCVLDYRPEILVTYLIHSDLFGRFFGRIFNIKTVVCSVRSNLSRSVYFPLFIIDGLTSFLVDYYHFNAPYVAGVYRRWFHLPEAKITVIPNGINFDQFKSINLRTKLRHDYGIGSIDIVIGSTAKLRPGKGHLLLLDSFSAVLKKFPSAKLMFIGGGPLDQEIKNRIAELGIAGKVIMTGESDNVIQLLSTFDVFVQASSYESMSNSLMEAMAAKLAVITTDIPENQYLVKPGTSGLLCGLSAEDFTRNINLLISDPKLRELLGHNAYLKILKEYNIKTVVLSWNKFLRTCQK